MHLSRSLLPLLLMLGACPRAGAPVAALPDGWSAPPRVELDLLRPGLDGPRIYVQATLPDGEPGLFMVDTGADITLIREDVAERLGLQVLDTGRFLSGMAGVAPLRQAVLPSLSFGEADAGLVATNLVVAVEPYGLAHYAGGMELSGVLGTDVLARFVVEIDYPADLMVLHQPAHAPDLPKTAAPATVQQGALYAPVRVTTAAASPHQAELMVLVDTGASELLVRGREGEALFSRDWTEGVEPVRGFGGSDRLPSWQYLQTTRRVHVDRVEVGGAEVDVDFHALWIGFDGARAPGPAGMTGLLGHEVLDQHRVWFDFPGQQFALSRSKRSPRLLDGHEVLLEQDRARYGEDPSRDFHRGRLLAGLERPDEAITHIARYLQAHPDDAEARAWLVDLYRSRGALTEAWAVLKPIPPGDLVDEEQIIATVNGLLLEGDAAGALALAEAAHAARPEEWAPLAARADVHVAAGRLDEADADLRAAATLRNDPDALLDRRARVALLRGDHHGALALHRRLVRIFPGHGPLLWQYALLAASPAEQATFRADLDHTVSRLHPHLAPLDFLVASYATLGDTERAASFLEVGLARDCDDDRVNQPHGEALRDNCVAWYRALAGVEPDDNLARVERALAETGPRSDFLDTKAVVHMQRGERQQALEAAIWAARLSPGDPYMLWQVDRIRGAFEEGAAKPSPGAEAAAGVEGSPPGGSP